MAEIGCGLITRGSSTISLLIRVKGQIRASRDGHRRQAPPLFDRNPRTNFSTSSAIVEKPT